jgi:hypothetical protein
VKHLSGAPLKGRFLALPTNKTMLERLARSKHFGVLRKFVTYGRKKFCNIGPWGLYYKTYYGRNLRIIAIS